MKRVASIISIILSLLFLQNTRTIAQASGAKTESYAIEKSEALQSIALYIPSKKKSINFSRISQKSIRKLLGKPLNIKIETGGVDTYKVFTYSSGKIYFDSIGSFDDLEITNSDWSFIFKIRNRLLDPVTIGSDEKYLRSKFPYSLSHREIPNNPFFIRLLDKDGTVNPYETINVKFTHGRVKSISYTFNNF